jgi:hypothetical protein
MSQRLTPSEREVVITISDDESTWDVFTDSKRFGGKLRRLAERWGVAVVPMGNGVAFRLPLAALRFVGPRRLSNRQAQHLSEVNARRPFLAPQRSFK